MDLYFTALIQLLAAHAQNTRNFQKAAHLFERLATSGKYHGDAKIEASAVSPTGDDRPGAARLGGGGAVVLQGDGDL